MKSDNRIKAWCLMNRGMIPNNEELEQIPQRFREFESSDDEERGRVANELNEFLDSIGFFSLGSSRKISKL